MPTLNRKYRAARSAEEIAQKRSKRAERSLERQAVRQKALLDAIIAGDEKQTVALKKKIDAADRAAKMHKPEQSADRKSRLEKLRIERDARAKSVASAVLFPRQQDIYARMFMPVASGKRDGAVLVAASPYIQYLMSQSDTAAGRADAAFNAMRDAVLLAGGGDRRKHPLHHGVVSATERDDLVERALALMVAAGGDLEKDPFVLIQHDGAGSEQGRHLHIAWCGSRDAGHSGCAVAARAWADAAGCPEAAQAPSLGTGAAAGRDWANIEHAGARLSAAIKAGRLGVPEGADAGGLFLYKGSWSAADSLAGKTARGKPVVGALAHLFGRD